MSRKHKRSVPATLPTKKDPYHVGTIDAITVAKARKPRFDGWVCRGGPHGDVSYNRRRAKAEAARIIAEG